LSAEPAAKSLPLVDTGSLLGRCLSLGMSASALSPPMLPSPFTGFVKFTSTWMGLILELAPGSFLCLEKKGVH